MCATRRLRISAANIGPNRFHQNRTVSWLMSIPRSAKRSSTLRSDSGYRTYIITTSQMTSGELLKYRNGLLMRRGYSRDNPRICSDTACATVRLERRFGTPSVAAGRRPPRSPSEPRRHRTALTNCSTPPSILRVSLFAQDRRRSEPVACNDRRLIRACGHPVRESYTFTPSQDEGSWKLLAVAMGLEPLEPRGRG